MTKVDEDDDEFRNQEFVRSMFGGGGIDIDDDDSDHDYISEHVWVSDETSVSMIYHLAFLAPGHGDRV